MSCAAGALTGGGAAVGLLLLWSLQLLGSLLGEEARLAAAVSTAPVAAAELSSEVSSLSPFPSS